MILTDLILFKIYLQGLIHWKRGLKIHDINKSLNCINVWISPYIHFWSQNCNSPFSYSLDCFLHLNQCFKFLTNIFLRVFLCFSVFLHSFRLIFNTFPLENSKKKGLNILPRPGIRSLCPLFRYAHLAKTVFSVQPKLPAMSALSKKVI